ncbi:hypothetical protein [Castellaniella denitrificans]|uniref:Uncharacterized protein n=1 Tax=Castellaniella denitrificans TaxID=56119 RepID=A0ABT4M8D9_9BURK|nr:hypothetical protein [Castellaniella denitrificans]MCZ4330735.1 hypothetical protein [Castellaniella denitrificans]
MTDRELLELAAKAIGRTTHVSQPDMPGIVLDSLTYWSPLEDDGDALRLSVNLGININYGNREAGAVMAFDFSGRFEDCEEEGDPHAAVRRAIVRAAAAIGRAMP